MAATAARADEAAAEPGATIERRIRRNRRAADLQ